MKDNFFCNAVLFLSTIAHIFKLNFLFKLYIWWIYINVKKKYFN